MKAGWETKKLGEIIQLEYGKPLADSDRNQNGLYPAYGANGIKDRTDKFFKGEPSIIVGRKGSAGEITLTKDKYWPLDVTFFVEFDRAKYELQYLYFLLLTLNLPSMAKGVKPGINRNDVYDITVTTFAIEEQRRIVTLLDEAFAVIATAKVNAEKNLQNARALYRSVASEMFSAHATDWPNRTLDQLATNLDSKRIPITKSDRRSGEYPYYGASGVVDYVDGYLFDGDHLLISEDGANLLARSTPIAFAASGKYWVNNHAHILKFDDMATQKFVELYLESIPLDEYITGAAQPKLNQKALNSIQIPIPESTAEQQSIVERLFAMQEQCDQLATVHEQKLAALDDLKKSLLHQAFSGQL